MKKKVTKEEKAYLEERLVQLEEQIADSNATIKEEGFRPAFCIGDGGFDDLPNFEMYQNNARLRQEISELRDTLDSAEVEEVSTEEIGLGTKFVATLNDLDGEVVTRKYTLFGGVFLALNQNTDFTLVSVNSPFGKAVISKKEKDEFSYVTPGKIVVSGVIDEIISEKEVEEEPKQKIKK